MSPKPPTSSDKPAVSPTRWGVVALVILAGVVSAGHAGKAPPALPDIRAEFTIGLVLGGLVISIFSITGFFLAPLAGSIGDRLGPRKIVLAGLGLTALGSIAGAFAGGETFLLVSRIIEGLGYTAIAVSAPAVIARAASGHDRRLALGIWGAYMPAGAALMMVLAPLMLSRVGWRGLWLLAGLLSLIWWLATARGTRVIAGQGAAAKHSSPPFWRHLGGSLGRVLGCPGPWLLALTFASYTMAFVPVFSWLPTFLIEQRGLGIGLAATLTALMVGVNAPGNILAGWLLRHGAAHWALVAIAGLVMGVCAWLFMSSTLGDGARYGLVVVFSFVGGLLPAAVLSAAPIFAPSADEIGTTNGMLVQGANTGLFVAPPLAGAIVAAHGGDWDSLRSYMAIAAGAMLLFALLIRGMEGSAAAGE